MSFVVWILDCRCEKANQIASRSLILESTTNGLIEQGKRKQKKAVTGSSERTGLFRQPQRSAKRESEREEQDYVKLVTPSISFKKVLYDPTPPLAVDLEAAAC